MSEMEGRGASWTEERGTSDEGRRRLKAAPEASGKHSMSVGAQADHGFSLDLNPGVSEMRDWVHGFARDVIRPAAAEWDEREETPWPILEQAAKIGLYSLDFFAQQWLEPSGLGIPVAWEELFWGDAGIALSIVGTGLAAVAGSGNGTHQQMGEWVPPVFGGPRDGKLGALCGSGTDAGSEGSPLPARGGYPEAT